MKFLLPLLALVVESSLVAASLNERNGIIYDGAPVPRNSLEERGVEAINAELALLANCAQSYNLFTTGIGGASPTGTPDPNFDYISFCYAFIQPTKTITQITNYRTTLTVGGSTLTVTSFTTATIITVRTSTTTPPPNQPTIITVTITATPTWPVTPVTPITTVTKPSDTPPVYTPPIYTPPTTTSSSSTTPVAPGGGSSSTPYIGACPVPQAGQICGQGGWGYAANNIYSGSNIDATACHGLCLSNNQCQSFQVEVTPLAAGTIPTCNLYKVDPSGNNTIASPAAPFLFFARNCVDYTPSSCSSSSGSSNNNNNQGNTGGGGSTLHVTGAGSAAPSTTSFVIVPPPGFGKRDVAAATLPWFLQPFGSATMSDVCSCIYTAAVPAITVTGVVPKTTSVYVTLPAKTVTAVLTAYVTVVSQVVVTKSRS